MSNVFLKVKVKTLAEEARIIRREERIKKAQARYARAKGKDDAGIGIDMVREQLYMHRKFQVRKEARCTHLAYAYLRGIPYTMLERTMKTQPNWENVARMVKKYGNGEELPTRWYKKHK